MKWNSFVFIVGFIIAFAGAYFFVFADSTPDEEEQAPMEEASSEENNDEDTEEVEEKTTIPEEAEALGRYGCLTCHSVDSMNIKSGNIGPDLSPTFAEIKGKHGKELDEFLREPTSAVMSTVLADDPLEEDEIEQIVEALKKASEAENEAADDEVKDEEDEVEDEE